MPTHSQDESKESDLLTTDEVAKLLKLAPGSIANMRLRKIGPAFIKFGASVRYRRSDIADFVENNIQVPSTSQDQKEEE